MAMIDVDEEAKVLKSDLKYIENEDINAIRYENGQVTVLSKKDGKAYERVFDTNSEWLTQNSYKIARGRDEIALFGSIYVSIFSGIGAAFSGNPLFLVPIASLVSIPFVVPKLKKHGKYNTKVEKLQESNQKEAHNIISSEIQGINIYQGNIDEVEKQIGKKLQFIDTGEPRKFIEEKDDFWLRAKASGLEADAIVHFQAGSPLRGTPIKFADEK